MSWIVDGNTYLDRLKITIDCSKIDATLTNFPVLVKLTSSNFDFSKANPDGFDIRFTEDDEETLLKYERERHDSGSALAEYWVNVPSVSDSVDTVFYMYSRTEDTADGADPTNVWNSSFKSVLHMVEAGTTLEDSTSNNKDATKRSATQPDDASSKIYLGQDFAGGQAPTVPDYADFADGAFNLGTNDIVISAWVRIDGDNGATRDILRCYGTDPNNLASLSLGIDNKFAMGVRDGDGDYVYPLSSDTYSSGATYYHVTAIYDASAHTAKVYVNGVEKGTDTNTDVGTVNTDLEHCLGAYHDAPNYNLGWNGIIDEFRVSLAADLSAAQLSAAWIKADYNSGNDSLLTYITNYSREFTNGLALADTLVKSSSKVLADGISLSDLWAGCKSYTREFIDGLALTDTLQKWTHKALSDGINLADTLQKRTAKVMVDGLQLGDSLVRGFGRTFADGIALGDVLKKGTAKVLVDGLHLGDVLVKFFVRRALRILKPFRVLPSEREEDKQR